MTTATNKTSTTDQVLAIAERVGASEGIEIVNVELLGGGGHRVLRITIDRAPGFAGKPEGVTHADCEFISQNVGTILDVEDVIPGARYTLEVTSPGLERKLTKPRDFERFIGHKIKVALKAPVGNQRHWAGVLKNLSLVEAAHDAPGAVRSGIITLETAPGKSIEFPLEQVERANLKFEW